jgi:hypothetical protein
MGVGNGPPQCAERLEQLDSESVALQAKRAVLGLISLFLHNLMQGGGRSSRRLPWSFLGSLGNLQASCGLEIRQSYSYGLWTSQELSWERGPSS